MPLFGKRMERCCVFEKGKIFPQESNLFHHDRQKLNPIHPAGRREGESYSSSIFWEKNCREIRICVGGGKNMKGRSVAALVNRNVAPQTFPWK